MNRKGNKRREGKGQKKLSDKMKWRKEGGYNRIGIKREISSKWKRRNKVKNVGKKENIIVKIRTL